LLIGNGNLPIRAGDLELSAWVSRTTLWSGLGGSYLDNGDTGSLGSGKMIFPVVSEPAAGC